MLALHHYAMYATMRSCVHDSSWYKHVIESKYKIQHAAQKVTQILMDFWSSDLLPILPVAMFVDPSIRWKRANFHTEVFMLPILFSCKYWTSNYTIRAMDS